MGVVASISPTYFRPFVRYQSDPPLYNPIHPFAQVIEHYYDGNFSFVSYTVERPYQLSNVYLLAAALVLLGLIARYRR